jgi:hypothetical protein
MSKSKKVGVHGTDRETGRGGSNGTGGGGDKAPTISKEAFTKNAKPMEIRLGDRLLIASPKEFSTGSLGFYAGDKIRAFKIGDEMVDLQVGINITVIGSKPAKASD